MNISIEQIDEMRKRTNCSYQEAKELLEKHEGDMVEAIVEFEKTQAHRFKHKNHRCDSSHGEKIKNLFHKGFITRFVIEKKENTILNIPINVLILALLITMPLFWVYLILFVAIYIMGYKIRIKKEEGEEVNINEIMDGIGSKVRTATDKMRENPAGKDQNNMKSQEKKEDGTNEIIVE